MSIKTVSVSSTAIKQLSYDDQNRTLTITFASGGTEVKPDVSKEKFESFVSAASAGKYYHANFK